jgi:integrase
MITDKQLQKAMREAPGVGKVIELRDDGERGSGRLVMMVKPRQARVTAEWYAVFHYNGRRAKAKIGSYPALTVAEARRIFQTDYAPVIITGRDPREDRRRAAAQGTLGQLFDAYIAYLRGNGKRSAKLVNHYLLHPKSGAAKSIGAHRPAASIMPGDIVPHLAKIHGRGSRAQANLIRAYLSAAFNFGLKAEHDYTKSDIETRWGLKINPVTAIPADPGAHQVGSRFLSPAEFRTFWLWLDNYRHSSIVAAATMLKMATGQRSEEILSLSDLMYDRQKSMLNWEKTKNGRPHSIPLPQQAAAILDGLIVNSHGLYFPNRRNPAICAHYESMLRVIKKFRSEHPEFEPFTARDLRRTWKTLAGDAGISKEMRDRLQNHATSDISSRHYDRYGYLPERRAAMAKWAAYLDLVIAGTVDQIGAREGNVVPFGVSIGAQP